MGIRITANHVGMTLVNMRSEIEDRTCENEIFTGDILLCGTCFSGKKFLEDMDEPDRLLGIRISIQESSVRSSILL